MAFFALKLGPALGGVMSAIAILAVMSGVWGAAALYVGRAAIWAYPVVVALALAPILLAISRPAPPRSADEARRIRRLVGRATLFEAIAIPLGAFLAGNLGRPDLVICVVAAVVGLHFLPLARWMPMPRYYVTGLLLILAAAAGVLLPPGVRNAAVAGAASAILWVTALVGVFSFRPASSKAA